MSEKPSLSVVLSFRNEALVLPELIRRLRHVLGMERESGTISRWELIFVNDSSADRSLEILREHARGQNDIKVVTMSRCFGVSPCVMAGFERATGDLVVYMDADLQDPPEVIPELLRALAASPGAEIVHTIRRSRAGETEFKLWLTRLGYRLLRLVSAVDIRIEAGDFKLLTRRAVDQMLRLPEKKPFMRGLVSWIGFQSIDIRYDREARFAGQTKFPILSLGVIRNFLDSALISFSGVPLQISALLGVFLSLVGIGLLIYGVAAWTLHRTVSPWMTVLILFLFVSAIQMFLLGIMGLYINAIFQESKRRPNYIVESTIGFTEAPHQGTESPGLLPSSTPAGKPVEPAEPLAVSAPR